jgi:glycogen debranching enzyme
MAPNGERAADATPDDAVRPNQLLLVTLGVLDDASIIDATRQLLVPGAIRTLDSGNSQYRGVYTGDENTSRKLAYHNGTAWPWPFPSFAEAAVMCGRMDAESALGLLSGAVDNLNTSCLGHMSEIADGDSPHAQKGCAAQAWSVSELLRVWLKLSDAAAREGDGQCKR